MEAVWEWFAWLDEAHGIKLTIFYDAYDRERFFEGLLTTIALSGVCIVLSLLIGVVGAWLQGSHLKWTRRLVQGYIQCFRNTPPLVQLYFFYFGVSSLLPTVETDWGGRAPLFDSFEWAVISLSFFAGAFNVEIFRAGIEAVPKSTVEAAEALGYTRLQIYRHVVLPLALRFCWPALTSNLVNLLKTTTLAYAIAVPELLYVSNQIWSDELNVPEMMNLLLVIYLFLVGVLVWLMHRWERAMRVPGFGHG